LNKLLLDREILLDDAMEKAIASPDLAHEVRAIRMREKGPQVP
jgi:hypothetical protein